MALIRNGKTQLPDPCGMRIRADKVACALGLALLGGGALAQSVTIQSTLQTRLTYTDNIEASATDTKSDWVGEIAPGVSISRQGGPLIGSLQAQVRGVGYADNSDLNSTFLSLNGKAGYEAITDLLFFDARAATSRDARSSLQGRESGDFVQNSKNNETWQFAFGPRVRFSPFGSAEGNLAYLYTWFGGGGDIEQREVGAFRAELAEANAFGSLGWGLDYTQNRTTYSNASSPDQSQWIARGLLSYDVTPRFRITGTAGRESNDYSGSGNQSSTIKGAGFDWTPSSRTTVRALYEDRIFGNGYDVLLQHRRSRSYFDASFSRDIDSSLNGRTDAEAERQYREIYDALGFIEDPVEREAEANRQLQEQYDSGGVTASVSSNYFVARTARLGYTLVGRRTTLRVLLQQSDRERLGSPLVDDPLDDLSQYETVTDRAVSLSLTRRFSPRTSGSALVTRSVSEGTGADSAKTTRTGVTLGISKSLGEDASGAVLYRYQKAEAVGDAADFTENVISASFGMRF